MMQNFAKLDPAVSVLPTSKLVIFPLLQPDPKLSFSCYFFQGQTDAFVETFKFPLGKGKKHCDVCLLNSSIFNLLSLNFSQNDLNSSWVMEGESEEANGSKIEGGSQENLKSIRGTK